MQLGLLTAILDGWSFEEMVDTAADLGFSCIEAACWPRGSAERRYAGVSHIDCARVCSDPAYAEYVLTYIRGRNLHISALAYYPNTMDPDPVKRAANVAHLKTVIRAAQRLGVDTVTTFVGRDQYKTVEENLALFDAVWPEFISLAEASHVKIAIENCPMLFGRDQWPGGQNLMCTPDIFRQVFARVSSPYFGLNFDPSHFVWQELDYIRAIYEFRDRIFHVHLKDIKLYPEKRSVCGVMAYPLEYMSPKLPGLGDVDWGAFLSALYDIGYDGSVVLEIEDKAFESSRARVLDAIRLSQRYVRQFLPPSTENGCAAPAYNTEKGS